MEKKERQFQFFLNCIFSDFVNFMGNFIIRIYIIFVKNCTLYGLDKEVVNTQYGDIFIEQQNQRLNVERNESSYNQWPKIDNRININYSLSYKFRRDKYIQALIFTRPHSSFSLMRTIIYACLYILQNLLIQVNKLYMVNDDMRKTNFRCHKTIR